MIGKNIIQTNGGITKNNDVSVKNIMYVKKIWNPATCNCENGKYLRSIMDDSAIICDEITYTEETNFNEKDMACKTQNFYILLAFLLIIITLLIAVSVCCYLIKYLKNKNIYYHFTTQN